MTKSSWKKKGIIIQAKNNSWWTKSHAMLPTIEHLENDLFKVYYCSRDKENRSHIGFSIIEIIDGKITIIENSKEPILSLGKLGTFDDNGVTPSCIINFNNCKFLYYIGWNKGSTIRMGLIAGLAVSFDKGKSFKRKSFAPLLERTNSEPYSILTAPYVIQEKSLWRMYYVSCDGWINKDLPRYNIKYAESNDGINWKREGHICIDYLSDNETALARPCVIKENNLYKMWFSYKIPEIGYRIGYAESKDGKNWSRIINSNFELDVSKTGWDSDMVEYPCVFNHKRIKYMLYNGNGYGLSGIGYATMLDV